MSLEPTKRKSKRCKICSESFVPVRSIQPTCLNFDCQVAYANKVSRKGMAERLKAERKKDRERKEKLKNRGDWVKEAQAAINKFRRLEELAKGRSCISCERTREEVQGTDGWKPGGAWDAGHFISVGANASLRFEPRNIWLQCKSCNAGSAKYAKKAATVAKSFEANLIALEGPELVSWLNGPHEPKHYTIEDLKGIRDHYRAKLKELKLSVA
ncbi:MAG TPA: recombination protein NinG [Pyrinomonadaceae bacterium]|nr:recombination protein NinG [Pyrinomonadaceae bacterium]